MMRPRRPCLTTSMVEGMQWKTRIFRLDWTEILPGWNLADGSYIVYRQEVSGSGRHYCSLSLLIINNQGNSWADYEREIPALVCQCLRPIPLQS